MSEIVTFRAPAAGSAYPSSHIPAHLIADQQVLLETLSQIQAIRKQADGLIGPIGLDALITPVPVAGAIYSGLTGLRLLGCASRARCSFGTRMAGMALIAGDVIIGAIIGVGDIADILFRSHAIYAGMIEGEIRSKLTAIGATQEAASRYGSLSERDLTRLEDTLHRGGKSRWISNLRLIVSLGLAALILYQCAG